MLTVFLSLLFNFKCRKGNGMTHPVSPAPLNRTQCCIWTIKNCSNTFSNPLKNEPNKNHMSRSLPNAVQRARKKTRSETIEIFLVTLVCDAKSPFPLNRNDTKCIRSVKMFVYFVSLCAIWTHSELQLANVWLDFGWSFRCTLTASLCTIYTAFRS